MSKVKYIFRPVTTVACRTKDEEMSSHRWHAETKESRPEMRKVNRESSENKGNRPMSMRDDPGLRYEQEKLGTMPAQTKERMWR
jgi:hypothetical protein